jgi:3-oxoacyl-[acyl-carrier protein] reductase
MNRDDFGDGGVFILGGSGGLGSAISLAFAKVGVPVALTYRTNRTRAENIAARIRAEGVDVSLYAVDGSDFHSVERAMSAAAERHLSLHSVIYAGGPTFAPTFFGKTSTSVWKEWLNEDVLAAINLAQASLPHLRRTKGAFAALSTYQGSLIEVRGGPSAIAKAAIDRMVAVIAKEEGRYGVRANTVRCGWFDVDANRRLFEQFPGLREQKAAEIPLRRLGSADDIGNAMLFLCSRQAGFITGVNLTADGGASL